MSSTPSTIFPSYPASNFPQPTPITHIVLFKYSAKIPWPVLQSHFENFLSLRTRCLKPVPVPSPPTNNPNINGNGLLKNSNPINGSNASNIITEKRPYMLSLKMGQNNSWEPFSKGMTHGFVLEFASQEDLDYYLLEDEVHKEFSREVGERGFVEDSLVVDIKDGVLFGPTPKKPGAKGGVFQGSCHCEEVKWTARLEKGEHILCHCDTCKKLGGGPYSLNQIIGRNDLTITQGNPRTYTYTGASGKSVHCYFCPRCTSHVYHHQEVMGDQIIVRTILLDGGKDMAAGGEIFGEGRLAWVKEMQEAV